MQTEIYKVAQNMTHMLHIAYSTSIVNNSDIHISIWGVFWH